MNGKIIIFIITLSFCYRLVSAQNCMENIEGRTHISLNGKWDVIIDPFDIGKGDWKAIWKDRKPTGTTDFFEYSFDHAPQLNVPGDFNSQQPELNYYESSVWYKTTFTYKRKNGNRLFIHFGAVNYQADIYINSKKVGSHEGGFTPFQFEITDFVNENQNTVIVRANNQRIKNGVPGLGFDWFNYGGITRDVNLVETSSSFIENYFIQLKEGSENKIQGWIKIDGANPSQKISIQIPEAHINYKTQTNPQGIALIDFPATLQLWQPTSPRLYKVIITAESDIVTDSIGFRMIAVKGTDILLNGKPIFLKGINIHEEIPQQRRRAYSQADASILLSWAKELGCNFVRLVHYPHNEYMIRLAEKMGLLVWEEIPVYQGIDFGDSLIQSKMNTMLREMINRDKNRCATIIWSLSNETPPSVKRNNAIATMAALCRSIDSTRLISSAFDDVSYAADTATIQDTLINSMDIIGVNEYYGWYKTWPKKPGEMIWISHFNKPLIISEFGAEALYGNHADTVNTASSWNEEYQERVFNDQLKMFSTISFLKGVCPWVLADFRSPSRMHPVYQQGWNRKGLISDKGDKKKAWYVIKKFYSRIN